MTEEIPRNTLKSQVENLYFRMRGKKYGVHRTVSDLGWSALQISQKPWKELTKALTDIVLSAIQINGAKSLFVTCWLTWLMVTLPQEGKFYQWSRVFQRYAIKRNLFRSGSQCSNCMNHEGDICNFLFHIWNNTAFCC